MVLCVDCVWAVKAGMDVLYKSMVALLFSFTLLIYLFYLFIYLCAFCYTYELPLL